MKQVQIDVTVNVTEVLDALEIKGLVPEIDDDTITVTASIDEENLTEAAVKNGGAHADEDFSLSNLLDQTDIFDLSAAIRRGDRREAEFLLDRLTADDTEVTEWVQQGRFSNKAKERPGPQTMLEAAQRSLAA